MTIPHIGMSYLRPFGEKWTAIANLRYSHLPDEIEASPLIESGTDDSTSVFIGFSRRF